MEGKWNIHSPAVVKRNLQIIHETKQSVNTIAPTELVF